MGGPVLHLQLVKCPEQTDEGSDTVNVKLQTTQSSTQHAAAAATVEQTDESPAALTAPPLPMDALQSALVL